MGLALQRRLNAMDSENFFMAFTVAVIVSKEEEVEFNVLSFDAVQ